MDADIFNPEDDQDDEQGAGWLERKPIGAEIFGSELVMKPWWGGCMGQYFQPEVYKRHIDFFDFEEVNTMIYPEERRFWRSGKVGELVPGGRYEWSPEWGWYRLTPDEDKDEIEIVLFNGRHYGDTNGRGKMAFSLTDPNIVDLTGAGACPN